MCTAPLINLLCMFTVLWKSRDVCTAAVCSIKRCMVMQYRQTQLFNKSPPLPCVESKPLTHSLASGVTTNSLLASWVHSPLLTGFWESLLCCAVYICSCPVWAHLACLTSWPPQPWVECLILLHWCFSLSCWKVRETYSCELEVVESSSAM